MKSAARVEIQAALCPAVQSNVLIEKDKSFFSSLLDWRAIFISFENRC